MDATDARILREMLRERVFFWGALDPRVSADDVARRLGIGRSTVHARVQAWRRAGLLRERAFVPHPSLFGATLAGGALRVSDAGAKHAVLDALAKVDGAFSALEHVGEWMAVSFVRGTDRELEARLASVRRIPGVVEMTPCAPLTIPPCKHEMTSLDWRIARRLREAPEEPLAASARAVGVSAKTFAKRYQELLASHALWFVPIVDFTRAQGTIARLLLTLGPSADRGRVAKTMSEQPLVLDVFDAKRLLPKAENVDVMVWLRNAAEADDAARQALAARGVDDVEIVFPRSWRFFGAWADEQLARRA